MNDITFQNFIDYYSLNFELEHNLIINNDYHPLPFYEEIEQRSFNQQEILDIMQTIRHMFKVIISIEASILAEHLELDKSTLMYLMFNYGKDAGINFYYSQGVYYNKDKV